MAEFSSTERMNTHSNNIIAGYKLVASGDLDKTPIRQHVSKDNSEASITLPLAERMMLESFDHLELVNRHLGNANAARAYFRRVLDIREKKLLGDPEKQEGARNIHVREHRMAQDEGYNSLVNHLTMSEELVSHLERYASTALEGLNVAKKLYDTASKSSAREG